MRSFSYKGLKSYLTTLGDFSEIDVYVMETPSRCYHVYVHQLQDLEQLTRQAIFNVDNNKIEHG
ncbi:hypothetical protein ATO00_04810 [Loigolactobacillus coryniformis subsp. coryniformis]|uniref:Uncharacterized protein n=3 Tax=Loigolactobacillus TaxID=2767889 RepID=A0A0R1F3E8_9LACO|nr:MULTISPECIES: hypothetical protein [Loigolactobacillus]OEH90353.1 hypothetical protein ATO00_04810 [Loigolactobacillus coryniformis subsp. coryniformis]RRG04265.1 MAG: hypothetical protein DUD28_08640 [Lactobacillus sp.]ATO54971.1 hypothetical protein LC20001_04735 [Loigolactobacillus coryniformis subsp. coryniformis KCTC 3167 = DSM 20001]KRK16365.1 hypothetical protein FD22_GL001291 [Loigolactobacillus coryniformis subsp. coryniformis KCTC 3167 = DSM 20001]QEA54337.1 hypothetical protein F